MAGRDPDAAAHHDLPALDIERRAQRVEQPLRGLAGSIASGLLEQHGELIATQARGGVLRPQRSAHPLRDGQQQLVARRVAQAVVDRLEVVEVEEQDRKGAQWVAPLPRDGVPEPIGEEGPVGEIGERVMECLVLELRLQLLADGDVMDQRAELRCLPPRGRPRS